SEPSVRDPRGTKRCVEDVPGCEWDWIGDSLSRPAASASGVRAKDFTSTCRIRGEGNPLTAAVAIHERIRRAQSGASDPEVLFLSFRVFWLENGLSHGAFQRINSLACDARDFIERQLTFLSHT